MLRVCQLPSVYTLPHSFANTLDLSTEYWDERQQRALEAKGIVPVTVRLRAGQTIVLPAGRVHVFKKCPTEDEDWRQAGLMFSVAGDASFVGASAKTFAREFPRLLACELAAPTGSSYTLCELALLRLVCDGPTMEDAVAKEHLKAAKIFFTDFVAQQEQLLARAANTGEIETMAEDVSRHQEWACSKCSRSLANVVLVGLDDEKPYCGQCCPDECRAVLRFFNMAQLEAMRDALPQ